jgi:AcrR family transcriptional regulator
MPDAGGTSPRERYRAQVHAEVKRHAWEQLATAGVSALSLNAIAKRMGMSGPALYRYFASRDELLTELIRDAYRSLADTIREAFDSGLDVSGIARVLREWALQDPHRYLLIYGTPVPGYQAPDETRSISVEIMGVLIDACAALPPKATPLGAHLENHRAWAGSHPAPAAVLSRALSFWTRLHGVLSLELAGHFSGMDLDPVLLFEDELASLL